MIHLGPVWIRPFQAQTVRSTYRVLLEISFVCSDDVYTAANLHARYLQPNSI